MPVFVDFARDIAILPTRYALLLCCRILCAQCMYYACLFLCLFYSIDAYIFLWLVIPDVLVYCCTAVEYRLVVLTVVVWCTSLLLYCCRVLL